MWNIWRTYGDGSKPYTPGEHQNSSGLWISVLQCIVERFFESINNLLAFSPSSQICLEKYDTYWNKSTARSHSWWHPSHSRGHKRDVHRSFGSTPSPSVARSSIGSPALSTQRRISPTNKSWNSIPPWSHPLDPLSGHSPPILHHRTSARSEVRNRLGPSRPPTWIGTPRGSTRRHTGGVRRSEHLGTTSRPSNSSHKVRAPVRSVQIYESDNWELFLWFLVCKNVNYICHVYIHYIYIYIYCEIHT